MVPSRPIGAVGRGQRTIVDFESAVRQPRAGTTKRLLGAFAGEGITFLPGTGLKLSRQKDFTVVKSYRQGPAAALLLRRR